MPGILKAHLFFWTDEPWDNAKLRKWIKSNAPHLDTAPFSANQPHFVCDPIIKDLDGRTAIDPLPARLGWRSGTHEVVALPPLLETQKAREGPWHERPSDASATPDCTPGRLTSASPSWAMARTRRLPRRARCCRNAARYSLR